MPTLRQNSTVSRARDDPGVGHPGRRRGIREEGTDVVQDVVVEVDTVEGDETTSLTSNSRADKSAEKKWLKTSLKDKVLLCKFKAQPRRFKTAASSSSTNVKHVL